MSILKRIEDIVLAAELKLRNLDLAEADHSDSNINQEDHQAADDSSSDPELGTQLQLELVEC